MWIEDPDGVRIVFVEVPADHPLRRDPRWSFRRPDTPRQSSPNARRHECAPERRSACLIHRWVRVGRLRVMASSRARSWRCPAMAACRC